VPPALTRHIQRETYSPRFRESVKSFLERAEHDVFDEPIGAKTAALLQAKRGEILDLVGRAERLAQALQARSPEFIVCHSDVHAGNLLMDAAGALYIVDWDNPILAPKERDLMFPGGGMFANRRTAQEEEALFYQGYGQTEIDANALAYYRYERIVQDIAAYCEEILLLGQGEADRERGLGFLASNFLPNNTIEIAYKADKSLERGKLSESVGTSGGNSVKRNA
jgi:spectinomycin phosphotransferase